MSLEIGEIERFRSAKHLASYAGTTPRPRASGDRIRQGRTRPDVNRYLKWAFAEAANTMARRPAEAAFRVLSGQQTYQGPTARTVRTREVQARNCHEP